MTSSPQLTEPRAQASQEAVDIDAVMHKSLAEIAKQPNLYPYLRLDISVKAQTPQMSLDKCSFSITLSPSIVDVILQRPRRKVNVPVLLIDEFGNRAGTTLSLWSSGETVSETVEVPIADRSVLPFPDPGRMIYVIVDPLNAISERSELNNTAKAYCYTIG